LNQNGNYWTYSKANLPPDGNLAFKQYVAVPGPSNQGTFAYAANTSTIAVDGTIKLTVTGKVNGVTRTVYATVRRRSFLDYLYFTDYETKDPALYDTSSGDPFTPAQAQVKCALHYYEARDPACILISFVSQDTINGPLHSNDAIHISGNPTFNGPVSTSWNGPAAKRWTGAGSPSFVNAGDPAYKPALTMPPSNSALRAAADGTVGGTGCLYTGPTQVTLNSTGTMTVVSPFTKSTNAGCGPGAGIPLPANGVIFVQNVPSTAGDPNYTNGCPYPIKNGYTYPPGLPVPVAGDLYTYGCRDGDVFVSGTLKGQLTVAADHNIVIVGNTKYNSGTTSNDVLGLIANNYIQVFHPVDCGNSGNGCNAAGDITNPIIQAAMISLQHSFIVPNYDSGGTFGTLTVTGAIAQKYRGPVGTFSGGVIVTGYAKAYTYDSRLKYLSPPLFLNPIQSAWQTSTWGEVKTPASFP
jgi:hypothetical protein